MRKMYKLMYDPTLFTPFFQLNPHINSTIFLCSGEYRSGAGMPVGRAWRKEMYKLMYDPTSFTPFFRPPLSTICMGRFMPTPLYIVVFARFVGGLSGD